MNIDPVIKVENLSKVYNISPIKSIWSKLPFFGNNHNPQKHLIWALKDINFEVKKGEALGVIGPNGAGKSTLLKMLCGVTKPTTGNFQIKGRVAPLIEIGAGFHPEMTGRENIWLNATIMGMSKKEIDRKFKDIVDFAELRVFIDTPFKKYSSGMKVRLGFATAIHCEPDVLLVDEVLSVGDIAFQLKCVNKLNKLCNKGTTIVLVSHNLQTIRRYATRTLFINNGEIVFLGDTQEACEQYTIQQTQQNDSKSIIETFAHGYQVPPAENLKDISFKIVDSFGNEKTKVMLGEEIEFHFSFFYSGKTDGLQIGIIIYKDGLYLVGIDSLVDGLKLSVDNELFRGILKITRVNLTPGKYTAVLGISNRGGLLLRGHSIDFFVVSRRIHVGFIDLPHEWNIQRDV